MPRHVPSSPPSADHASHDRFLVVRLASDDLSDAERSVAEALRASCADCTALARDVGLISRATVSLPAARRPRDFRLSPEQAQQAHGPLLRRLMERLAAPRLGILQPLGAAAVAIGFVLVVVGMGLPGMGGTPHAAEEPAAYSASNESPAADAGSEATAPAEDALDPEAPSAAAAPGQELDAGDAASVPPTRAQPSSFKGITRGGTDPAPAGGGRNGTDAPGAEAEPSVEAGGPVDPAASPVPPELTAAETVDDADQRLGRTESGTPAGAGLVTLGLLLGLAGLLVIILRVLSQRIGRDPAIR